MHHVYIVRCADDSLYVGITQDLVARVKAHNEGRGAKYTFSRRPVKLVYSESCANKSAALQREIQLKSWTRSEKKALIAGESTLREAS